MTDDKNPHNSDLVFVVFAIVVVIACIWLPFCFDPGMPR